MRARSTFSRSPRPRSSRPLTPEGATLKAIRRACAYANVPCYRLAVGAFEIGDRFVRMGSKGLPDLLLLTKQGAVFVEVKSEKGRLTPEQRLFQEQCQTLHIAHVVARSVLDVQPWLNLSSPT